MIPHEWLLAADSRIRPTALVTPVTEDPRKGIFLKWENHQLTGSFKLRGALNKILTLEPWERERGLVTCSAGNHGQGAAVAASQTNSHLIVFAPAHAVPIKITAMQALGAEVRLVAGGYELAEQAAQQFAQKEQMTFISPYNDGQIIAGQGTIGLELARQIPTINAGTEIYVPLGGGGLLAGVASAFQESPDKPHFIGVQSEASPFFYELFTRGSQEGVLETESLADGLAGRVQDGSITIPMVHQLADEVRLVSEDDIRSVICWCWREYSEKIEGSAAVALAAALNSPEKSSGKVVILSGGNIQSEVFERICAVEGSFNVGNAQ